MSRASRRQGFFEAPSQPATSPRLRIDPTWSSARLSAAVIRAALWWVLAGCLLLVMYNVAVMLLPAVIGQLVDDIVAPAAAGATFVSRTPALMLWATAMAGLYAAINLGYRFGGRLGWFGLQRCQFELSLTVLERILHERGVGGQERAPGGLLAVATADVRRACLALYVAVYPPGEIVGLLVGAGVLLTVHPGLGVTVMISLPIVLVLMHLAARPLRRRSLAEQAGLADAAAAAADLVAGYRVIRGIHAQRTAADRYREVSRSALRSTLIARSARAGFEGLSTGTAQFFAAAVAVAAAVLAFTGQITAGQLVTVAGVAVAVVAPLESLVGTLGSFWAVSQASARRVLEILATESHPASRGETEPGSTATVRFDELCLNPDVVLDGEVGEGEFVVVELPAAAAPVLAEVLAARAFPRHGQALYGGVPTHECRPAALRARMLVVPHTAGLLAGTVLDNVRANGNEPAAAEVARAALRTAGLLATELPDGYATIVVDAGWELSGGQRQRIGLARGVAADPEILVLVEPTTSVDALTEQRIATQLRAHRAGRTTIVLTASPAFRGVADRVLAARSEAPAHG